MGPAFTKAAFIGSTALSAMGKMSAGRAEKLGGPKRQRVGANKRDHRGHSEPDQRALPVPPGLLDPGICQQAPHDERRHERPDSASHFSAHPSKAPRLIAGPGEPDRHIPAVP